MSTQLPARPFRIRKSAQYYQTNRQASYPRHPLPALPSSPRLQKPAISAHFYRHPRPHVYCHPFAKAGDLHLSASGMHNRRDYPTPRSKWDSRLRGNKRGVPGMSTSPVMSTECRNDDECGSYSLSALHITPQRVKPHLRNGRSIRGPFWSCHTATVERLSLAPHRASAGSSRSCPGTGWRLRQAKKGVERKEVNTLVKSYLHPNSSEVDVGLGA